MAEVSEAVGRYLGVGGAAAEVFLSLSTGAREVLGQLFVLGPVWDGNVLSKAGRGELCGLGLAFHADGWASLTPAGVGVAVWADIREVSDRSAPNMLYGRWRLKQGER